MSSSAELVHLSPSPCLMRVKKLQSEGYIRRLFLPYQHRQTRSDYNGIPEITLKNHRQVDFARFPVDCRKDCLGSSNATWFQVGYDYLIKVRHQRHRRISGIMERLIDMDIGIDRYFSYVVLKSPIVKSHLAADQPISPVSRQKPAKFEWRLPSKAFRAAGSKPTRSRIKP